MKTKFISLFVVLSLAGCANLSFDKTKRETLLFNPVIESQSLEVSVMTYGCTKAEDFYLKVKGELVELRRINEDNCRKAPALMRLSFEYPFGSEAYRFKNDVRFSNRIDRR